MKTGVRVREALAAAALVAAVHSRAAAEPPPGVPPAGLSVADALVTGEACEPQGAAFAVTLWPPRGVAVTVGFATEDGTALAGSDYTGASGTLTFDAGATLATVIVPVADVPLPGPDKAFRLRLSDPVHSNIARAEAVATIRAPSAAKCQICSLSCDDGAVCTHDFCSPTLGCRHVDRAGCSLPAAEADCGLPSACHADLDGDGLSDTWESRGGIDFDCDGAVTPDEKVLHDVDPVFPDGAANAAASADPVVKDVFLLYDWMELPDELTGGQPTPCVPTPLPPGPPNFLNVFYPFHSDACGFDQMCQAGVCRGHSDAPDAAALRAVIDAFAEHQVRLHLVRGHALPHANVAGMGPPLPACVADSSSWSFTGASAVNFYEVKTANLTASYGGQTFSESQLLPVFHYAVFAHRHTCDSIADCTKAACVNPDTHRSPEFNSTGLAEQPGNDVLVSLGGLRDRGLAPATLASGGTFMHELGHNLGLDHGGPVYVGGEPADPAQFRLNYKPNYLSVMSYNHQMVGVETADPGCAPGDYACLTTPVGARLDYSSFANGVVPNVLDEHFGSEAAGLGLGGPDIAYTWCGGAKAPIPGVGPVDFNCNGSAQDTWCDSGCSITPSVELNRDPFGGGQLGGDVLLPVEDWPNLVFTYQCQPTFNDGAAPSPAPVP